MSEALNEVFIDNFHKDPTLTWQYFGSSTGFFRLYPGVALVTAYHIISASNIWLHGPNDALFTANQRLSKLSVKRNDSVAVWKCVCERV